jgi:membrane protein DedA with SNARE-associated domain
MDCHVLTAVATALGSTGLSSGQPVLPGFLNSLSSPLAHYGLWAILVLVLVEDFGIPVPGETVLIAGAIFAGSGRLNVVAVGVVGFVSAVVGDNIGYAIGRFGGRALVDRWGKYVFLTPERLDKAEDFFERHGSKIITIARFVEGLRQANGLIAGITHMHWLRFLIFNALGAALWVGTWVSVGYFAGQHITAIYNAITAYSLYAAIAAVVLIAAWIGFRVRKRRKSAAAATQADSPAGSAQDAELPGNGARLGLGEVVAVGGDQHADPADRANSGAGGPGAGSGVEVNGAGADGGGRPGTDDTGGPRAAKLPPPAAGD